MYNLMMKAFINNLHFKQVCKVNFLFVLFVDLYHGYMFYLLFKVDLVVLSFVVSEQSESCILMITEIVVSFNSKFPKNNNVSMVIV